MATNQSDSDVVFDSDDEIQQESLDNTSSESDTLTEDEEPCDAEVENPKQKRRSRLFPLHLVLSALCCPSLCLAGFTEADLAPLRENFQSLDRTEKRQWLLDYFWNHSQFDDESCTWRYKFVLGTKEVCRTAFRVTLGIASSTFYVVRKLFLSKKKVIAKPRIKRQQTKSMQAMAWLHSYANKYGEKRSNTSKIYLPPHSTKQNVYKTMVKETQCAISQSHFLRLWREEASQITIPKTVPEA